jgi:hypothetical protein
MVKKNHILMIDLSPYFGTLTAVAALVLLVTGWVKTHLVKVDGWKANVLSWVVSGAIAFVGKWQGLGIFADSTIIMTVINAVAVGLVANGLYTIDVIQTILALLKAKMAKKA